MMGSLSGLVAVFRRELHAYFSTPLAYVFIAVFLLALGAFTWEAAGFFDTGRADLAPFFVWHPWLYCLFMPALAMRAWPEETAQGTDELLFSLPVSLRGVVVGKWLAAWVVAGAALALTLPMWLTVNYLGPADNTAIALTYIMSLLMAGAYLSLSLALSALAGRQVAAFVLAVVVTFVFTAAGWPLVLSGVTGLFGAGVADAVASFSFTTQFEPAQRGVLDGRSVGYFTGVILLGLGLSVLWASRRRDT